MTRRPIFYDTETTGVRPDKDRIIELAAFDPVEGRTFVQLINPGCPIPPDATAIHTITDEMVAPMPPFSEIIADFIAFCQGDTVLVAHNNDGFDLLFLQQEFARCSTPFPAWNFFDSLKWARRYRPDLPRHSLQFLREVYGIAPNQAHRALDDVMVLHRLFEAMVDDLPIETASQLLSQKKSLTCMPFGKHQGKPLHLVPKDYVLWLEKSGALAKVENSELRGHFEKLGYLQEAVCT